jgi:hypothetical protein
MTPNNDIRDLLGRYAMGSLTAEEHKRLFDAALDDQELFDELAREDEVQQLITAPGVRDRLIHSLQPPRRRVHWVFALVPVAVLSALLIVVLMRPAPKHQPIAVATTPASPVAAPAAPQETAMSAPQAIGVPERVKTKETDQSRGDQKSTASEDELADAKQATDAAENAVKKDVERRVADQKEAAPKAKAMDQVAAAHPAATPTTPVKAEAATAGGQVQVQASQVQLTPATQQNAPGGPRQNAVQEAQALSRAAGKSGFAAPRFGIHYSIQTAGHLILIPAADGYLSVKSADGAVLFAPQPIAAGSLTDISLPSGVQSMAILFSAAQSAPRVSPTVRSAVEDTVEAPAGGPLAISIELKLKP